MKYQVTMYTNTGKYRPVSAIVESDIYDKADIKNKGIKKICQKRYWTGIELRKYGYTLVKVREYPTQK